MTAIAMALVLVSVLLLVGGLAVHKTNPPLANALLTVAAIIFVGTQLMYALSRATTEQAPQSAEAR